MARPQRGEIPFFEPFLEELVVRQRALGRLRFTKGLEEALPGVDVTFICVATLAGGEGEADLSAVENVVRCQ